MYRFRQVTILLALSLFAGSALAQAKKTVAKDVDPLALDVLRAVVQPIEQAQTFSFRALVSEEELATNGQLITFFHTVDVSVQRPDKVHLIFRGRGQEVDYYADAKNILMYSPAAKLYTSMPAQGSIDATLANLSAKGVDMPIAPFLRSDLYKLATSSLDTGYVIGRVKLFDQDVHQLAFTEPDADWQIWVVGGENPRIIRVEVVNKKLEGKPRTAVQFLNWNLSPSFSSDEFTFTKPDDAHEISVLPGSGGN